MALTPVPPGGDGGGGVEEEDDLDDFVDDFVEPEAEDAVEPPEEALAVDEDEEDSLESYLLIGLGGEGNSSQFTQPSLPPC